MSILNWSGIEKIPIIAVQSISTFNKVHSPPNSQVDKTKGLPSPGHWLITPQIILADEPTAALDMQSSVDVVKMLKKIALEQEVAIVMVTHDDRMLPYCDKIMKIEDKSIVFE